MHPETETQSPGSWEMVIPELHFLVLAIRNVGSGNKFAQSPFGLVTRPFRYRSLVLGAKC